MKKIYIIIYSLFLFLITKFKKRDRLPPDPPVAIKYNLKQ